MKRHVRLVTHWTLAGLAAATLAAAFAAAVVLAAPASNAGPSATAAAATAPAEGNVVSVTYFHTTQRCASCRKIEALSTDAIRNGFAREIENGRVAWRTVNLDEPGNQHYFQDYKLFTKSLVVVDLVGGREARWKNLPKIWELLRDEMAFRNYVQSEVRAYLDAHP